MGPRLFSRGNRIVAIWRNPEYGCFNGAATLQSRKSAGPRKGPEWIGLQRGRDSSVAEMMALQEHAGTKSIFASMGPRLFSRGNHSRLPRSNWCASMGPRLFSRGNRPFGRSTGIASASMGPRLFSRGNGRTAGASSPEASASMGPRLFSRGNARAELAVDCQIGFNGAATLQSRKCERRGDQLYDQLRFNGAATLQSRKYAAPRSTCPRWQSASMGPRLFSRGNWHASGRAEGVWLQWGRDSSVAEIASKTPYASLERFNGAATLQSRKCLRTDCRIRTQLSMGPRLFSRGNQLHRR